MSSPKVSIVMATHNQSATLAQALESVLAQDFSKDEREILVVNDGSTDQTQSVLSQFGDQIQVFTQPQKGLPAACNEGLLRARGRYFARVDSDDWVDPTWLSQTVDLMEQDPDTVCVIPDYLEVPEDGPERPRQVQQENLYSMLACGTLLKTELLRKIGGFRSFYWEEYDLYLRLREQGSFQHLKTPLYFIRLHSDSMTASVHQRKEGWQQLLGAWGPDVLQAAGQSQELEEVIEACP